LQGFSGALSKSFKSEAVARAFAFGADGAANDKINPWLDKAQLRAVDSQQRLVDQRHQAPTCGEEENARRREEKARLLGAGYSEQAIAMLLGAGKVKNSRTMNNNINNNNNHHNNNTMGGGRKEKKRQAIARRNERKAILWQEKER
jgi:DNA-binding NarL/FixJ family response regulator